MQKASFRGKAMNKFEKDKRNCHPAGDKFFHHCCIKYYEPHFIFNILNFIWWHFFLTSVFIYKGSDT